jgi:pimeloyl-ACP methyl ester carboxylesterase
MADKSKIAFILVPGSFSKPTLYNNVLEPLTSSPHSFDRSNVLLFTLPSTNHERAEGPATVQDDAAALDKLIEEQADKGFDVVVAMNSYGGFVGTEATKGLSKGARAKEGKSGGVISLVYLAAHLPYKGQSCESIAGTLPFPDSVIYMSLAPMRSPEMAQGVFPDSTPEEAMQLFDEFTQHSLASFKSPLTYEAYKDKDIKVFYMHMLRDNVLKPEWQKDWLATAKNSGVDVEVVTIDGGHCPMVANSKEVADLLAKAATV